MPSPRGPSTSYAPTVDRRPRGRLLGFRRVVALDRPQCPEGCVSEVQLQLCAPVVVGELLQLFEPGLELRDRFGIEPAGGALLDCR